MAEEDLTHQQLKNLLQDTLQIFQNSGTNLRKDDYSILRSVIWNIDFFHTNLEAPANLHDFSQMIKYHLNYEVHSQGTALMKEGEYANKFYVLLKGTIQKLKPRTFEDLEQEVQEQSPRKRNKMKKQMTYEPEEYIQSHVKRDIPRYLQHTLATQKKTAVVKPDFFTSALNDSAETKSEVKPKFLRLKSTLDVPKRASTRKQSFEPSTDAVVSENQQGVNSSNNSFISSNNQSYIVMNVKEGSRSPSPEKQDSILNKVNGSSQPSVQELSEGEDSEEKDDEEDEEENDEDNEDDDTDSQTAKRKKARLLKNGMTEDDVNFIKLVAKQNPDIENRCFLGEIIRVKKDRTLKIGGYFGENFFRRNRPKEECIMAVSSEEAHFLILTRENYEMVMADICKQSQEKAKFFLDLFPFYDELIVKKFSYHFSEKEFKKNDPIFQQGAPASELYLLRNGDVRLFKEVEASPQDIEQNLSNSILVNLKCSGKVGVPIATVMKNQFFGDEVLLKQDIRQYTGLAIGSSTTYFLKANVYHKIKSYFSDLLKILRDHSKERFIHREVRVKELLERKKQTTEKSLSKKWSQDRMSTDALKAHLGVRWGKDEEEEKKKKKGNSELRLGYKSPDSHQNSQTDLKSSRILHTESSVQIPVPVPTTLQAERIDFSRKARIVDNLLDGQYIRRKVEDSIKESSRSPPRHNIEDFNMVKELHPKNNRVRLPSLQSSRSPSPQKVLYTERSGITRPTEPDVTNSPVIDKRFNSKRSHSIETLVTEFIYDEIEEDGPRRERKLNKETSKSISKVINLEELRSISKKSAHSLTAKTEMNNKIRRCVQTIVNTNKILRSNGPTCLKLAIQGKRKMVEEMSGSDTMKLSAVFGKKSELQVKGQK